jgi:hypothetical protein
VVVVQLKRGNYAYISYDGGDTRTTTRKEIPLRVVWVRGMGRSCVH